MILKSIRGTPAIVSQSFPTELWKIGTETIEVDMGSPGHGAIIRAAKDKSAIIVETIVKLPGQRD